MGELIEYALQGLVDGLRDQLHRVRGHQMKIAWITYVHQAFEGLHSPAHRRRRQLVLSLPTADVEVARKQITTHTTELAAEYAGKSSKTVTRDINALEKMGLIKKTKTGISSRFNRLQAFLPYRFDS